MKVLKIILVVGLILFGIWGLSYNDSSDNQSSSSEKIQDRQYPKQGDLSNSGGSPTIRKSTPIYYDDLDTSNDESNDQPVGFYGTDTMYACNQSSGNCYDLDVDSSGEEVERLYFPKGGWVDIDYSDCDSGYCYAEDENGTEWELEY